MPPIPQNRRGQLPAVEPAVRFTSPERRSGWRIALPGRHPLATPAVVGGRVFLGGGFGSYEFYALDAVSGAVVWQYQTGDDGPTAAVVADGFIAFNTESCELEILNLAGRPLWKQWLGDPLLSMPALGGGHVYMAYPDSRGDHRHYLACFDVLSGARRWARPIDGEIITAPVLDDGKVYLATLDGTIACFRQEDGGEVWREPRNATSAPTVRDGQCYFSRRKEVARAGSSQQTESLAKRACAPNSATHTLAGTERDADYLDHGKRAARSPRYASTNHMDAAVGFGAHKGDAKIHQAMHNLGHGHISALWAYQGSKPFVARGRMYSGLGDTVHCVDPRSEATYWKRALGNANGELLDAMLTPPALANGKVFVGTADGVLHCLDAESGATLWSATLGEPILFQPAVAAGRVYAASSQGSLFCLETGDPADDGWPMWGGSPGHNGGCE